MAPSIGSANRAIHNGEIIGEGGFRTVYGTKTGKWVYKVDDQRHYRGSNRAEYDAYVFFRDNVTLPEGIKIPEMHLLEGNILAAERIKGKHPENWCTPERHCSKTDRYLSGDPCPGKDKCWAARFEKSSVHISDLHPYNVICTRSGDVYVIDLGHES